MYVNVLDKVVVSTALAVIFTDGGRTIFVFIDFPAGTVVYLNMPGRMWGVAFHGRPGIMPALDK